MRNQDWPGHLPRGQDKAEDHRGNFSGGRGKADDGELLFEAEDEELKPPRNLSGGRGKAEDGEQLPGVEDEESRPLSRRGQLNKQWRMLGAEKTHDVY